MSQEYSVWRCSDCGHWVGVTTITRTHITKRRMPAEVAAVEICRLLNENGAGRRSNGAER